VKAWGWGGEGGRGASMSGSRVLPCGGTGGGGGGGRGASGRLVWRADGASGAGAQVRLSYLVKPCCPRETPSRARKQLTAAACTPGTLDGLMCMSHGARALIRCFAYRSCHPASQPCPAPCAPTEQRGVSAGPGAAATRSAARAAPRARGRCATSARAIPKARAGAGEPSARRARPGEARQLACSAPRLLTPACLISYCRCPEGCGCPLGCTCCADRSSKVAGELAAK
jgi:hypothetical protein